MSDRCAGEKDGPELSEGGRLMVTVEFFTDNVIVVSARLGSKSFRGALLSTQFEWIKPIVSENVFNWDYSLKHNFAHTQFTTTDSLVLPSKLLSTSSYICDNCKKKMFNNHKTENKLSFNELSKNICKSDILLLKQTLSYSELPTEKPNLQTVESRPCKRLSLDIVSRKIKRKKVSNVVDKKSVNKDEQNDVTLKLRPPKVEKSEEKPSKESRHRTKPNNEPKTKSSIIKSESLTSNHGGTCHGNYRVMPQSLERLNNISVVESNQEIEDFFNRECPKPKKKWMKMNEKEDNQNNYESINKDQDNDSQVTCASHSKLFVAVNTPSENNPVSSSSETLLEIPSSTDYVNQCLPFQFNEESFENPFKTVSFKPTGEEYVDNFLCNTIVEEFQSNCDRELVAEDFAIKSVQDFSLELSDCIDKNFFSESLCKDSSFSDCCDLKLAEIENLPLQSIIEDYPLESVIKTSIESISKYFTYESISKDFPIEFITTDLSKKSFSNDHASSFKPIIDSAYNEDFTESFSDNFNRELKFPKITTKSLLTSKYSHSNRSYKIKQSLHDKVILTVERGSVSDDVTKKLEPPDVYSFTDEDDFIATDPLSDNCVVAIPRVTTPLLSEVDSAIVVNNDESKKSLKSNKRPKRHCTNKNEKNVLERKIKLENNVNDEMNDVPLLNSCENNNGTIFKIDDVVWAKITGYPYWPARIISFTQEDNIFISCIEWYAWKEVSFIKVNNLFHFKEFYKTKYQRKKRNSKYQEAVKMAKSCCGMLDGVDSVISDDCRTLCSTRGSDSDSGSHEGSGTSAS